MFLMLLFSVDGFYLRDCEKVMDQLVEPMRFLKLDNKEFVALKACVLFNPGKYFVREILRLFKTKLA